MRKRRTQNPKSQAYRYQSLSEKQPLNISWAKINKILLKIILTGGITIAVLWSVWSFHESSHQQPIEKVQVISTYSHVDAKTIQNIIAAHLNSDFFNIDMVKLKQDMLALPWIKDIAIKRKWPNIIIITITEQQPIARWKDTALLNAEGMLFTPPINTFPENLPTLRGPEEMVQEIVESYQQQQKLLSNINFSITQVDVNERHYWHLIAADTSNNKIDIFEGNENPTARLQTFVNAYPKITANHKGAIRTIDLRYGKEFAITWEPQV